MANHSLTKSGDPGPKPGVDHLYGPRAFLGRCLGMSTLGGRTQQKPWPVGNMEKSWEIPPSFCLVKSI